jgi:Transcriptional regulatory protein, C terminal
MQPRSVTAFNNNAEFSQVGDVTFTTKGERTSYTEHSLSISRMTHSMLTCITFPRKRLGGSIPLEAALAGQWSFRTFTTATTRRFSSLTTKATGGGTVVHLTPREFDALRLLMTHAGRPVTHFRLLAALRGPDAGSDRAYLRVLIGQLRKKIEEYPAYPKYLLTDSYIGYRFREP